jgi:hypothetical protein
MRICFQIAVGPSGEALEALLTEASPKLGPKWFKKIGEHFSG